ncbi:hypothetical protein ACHAPT_000572 [Fusarium lateritium]
MSADYTKFHLSAITFLHPPAPLDIKQCPCYAKPEEPTAEQNTFIRVYHTEPSIYGYNAGCSLVKESRYSTLQQWHGPTDDLVADDAAPGSPVTAIGWWADVANEVWETRVYYIGKSGKLQERINRSHFAPTIEDDFDLPLPKPEELIPPTPGWKLTQILGAENFPDIQPLPETKLAAVRSGDGKIRVFYQGLDNSIFEAIFDPESGWAVGGGIVDAAEAKAGTPLTAISGGWAEVRLFLVDPSDALAYVYADDHSNWTRQELPAYKLPPTAMLSAIAWNYASPFFEIRIYTTDDRDELHEFIYSRNSGGWASYPQSVNNQNPGGLYFGQQALSAVAAVLLESEWKTKVYFHPRRTILEWDVCNKLPPSVGIYKPSQQSEEKRAVEEETRVKIAEDEERKRIEEEERKRAEEEARQKAEEEARRQAEEEEAKRKAEEEEERKRVEAEEARQRAEEEEARKRAEEQEEQKRAEEEAARQKVQEEVQKYRNVQVGGKISLEDKPEVDRAFKEKTGCTAGFEWGRTNDGWRCAAGGHFLTNDEFETLSRGG